VSWTFNRGIGSALNLGANIRANKPGTRYIAIYEVQ